MFKSSEDFFNHVDELLVSLDKSGKRSVAEELYKGMRCINGLTDGYFDFLSFIEKAYRDDFPKLNPQQQKSFLAIYRAVYYAANRGLLKLSVLYWWYSLRHLIKRTK